jgi:hypothetical protein
MTRQDAQDGSGRIRTHQVDSAIPGLSDVLCRPKVTPQHVTMSYGDSTTLRLTSGIAERSDSVQRPRIALLE